MLVPSSPTRRRAGIAGKVLGAALVGLALNLTIAPGFSQVASAQVAEAPRFAAPASGGPGTRFVFTASGFVGDPDEGDDDTANDAERVIFWVNTPDGRTLRGTRDGGDADKLSSASSTRATRAGTVSWEWRAPLDAVAGSYTLVAHGLESERNVVIPFEVTAGSRGVLLTAPASATPSSGTAGTDFTFVAGGFLGDSDDGEDDRTNDAEKVVFWVNAPDGSVIKAIRAGADEDAEGANQVRASRAGTATLNWTAPKGIAPGTYTLVAHGLESDREQVITFQIR